MVALLNKNIIEYSKRREECLASVLEKIKDILDFTSMYNMNQNKEMVKLVMLDIKSKVKTTTITDDSGQKIVRYFETIPQNFIDDTVSICEDIYNNILSHEVKTYKKDLRKMADIPEIDINDYTKSINDMAYLYGLTKEKDMEKEIFKIKQDLTSCINYNSKIEREMGYE